MQEGLNTLTFTRHVSVMSITLSTVPLDPTRPGYQAPLPLDQVKPLLPPSRSHPGAALVPRRVPSCHKLPHHGACVAPRHLSPESPDVESEHNDGRRVGASALFGATVLR